jgi:hypothetical protein
MTYLILFFFGLVVGGVGLMILASAAWLLPKTDSSHPGD